MELLLILAVAGGLIWLLASGSKKPGAKNPASKPGDQPSDYRQDPPTKD